MYGSGWYHTDHKNNPIVAVDMLQINAGVQTCFSKFMFVGRG